MFPQDLGVVFPRFQGDFCQDFKDIPRFRLFVFFLCLKDFPWILRTCVFSKVLLIPHGFRVFGGGLEFRFVFFHDSIVLFKDLFGDVF